MKTILRTPAICSSPLALALNLALTAPAATALGKLEEVIVTAQKRAELLHDVPISISVIQGATVTRAVIGGTVRFATASGEVTQRRFGRNTSRLRGLDLPYGKEPPSPNFRLTFELLLWA
ncbi:MAG: hypothetical protein KDI16_00105 [Halioglobus sp.]|nr:hypothetical protein [Halioglobus sp.]